MWLRQGNFLQSILNSFKKNEDLSVKLSNLKAGGGMVANEMLVQCQSDMLNVPVIRPKVSETTALGAAYAAGLAVNFWSGLDELRKNWSIDKAWRPDMKPEMRKKYYLHWKKAVDRTLDWVETSH